MGPVDPVSIRFDRASGSAVALSSSIASGSEAFNSSTSTANGSPVGSTVTGEATPLHVGRRSSVWQTRLTNDDGKLLALVTQTQMTVEA